jgi:pimeloyl-ACP methyl ester carboxylesterase
VVIPAENTPVNIIAEVAAESPATSSTATPSLDELLLFLPLKIDPAQRPETPPGVEDLRLMSRDGTNLHAWWRPHPQPIAHVLYLHGNAGNLWTTTNSLKWLHETAECSVLAVDYRGYGLSEGAPHVEGVLQDVRAAREELRRRMGSTGGREVLIGRSLGGALAVDLAAERPPQGLVLECTFSSFRDVARFHAGKLAEIVPPNRLNSMSSLAKYPGPLLQVHGDVDRVVPFEQGERLHTVATGPKQFVRVDNGGHNDVRSPEYLEALRKYLRELP